MHDDGGPLTNPRDLTSGETFLLENPEGGEEAYEFECCAEIEGALYVLAFLEHDSEEAETRTTDDLVCFLWGEEEGAYFMEPVVDVELCIALAAFWLDWMAKRCLVTGDHALRRNNEETGSYFFDDNEDVITLHVVAKGLPYDFRDYAVFKGDYIIDDQPHDRLHVYEYWAEDDGTEHFENVDPDTMVAVLELLNSVLDRYTPEQSEPEGELVS